MVWVEIPSEQAFTEWHNEKCSSLGIPRPGFNGETGELDLKAQWTTAYAEPVLSEGKLLLNLSEKEATPFTPTLEPISSRSSKVPFKVHKDIPVSPVEVNKVPK